MEANPVLITPTEIVRRYRLSYQTLNYYTNLGLLRVVRRNGNERLYREREVRRHLQTIGRLKNDGYPLRLISRMLSDDGPRAMVRAASQVRRVR